MGAGTLDGPEATFCRMLNRSMTLASVPVFTEIKPFVGADAAAKLDELGLS